MDISYLKLHIGEKFYDKKSKRWLTIEKLVTLSKVEYVQFKELDNIYKLSEFELSRGVY